MDINNLFSTRSNAHSMGAYRANILGIVTALMLTGCASTGVVYERIDGKLELVKRWSVKGTQITKTTDFEIDTKQENLLEGLIKIQDAKVVQ